MVGKDGSMKVLDIPRVSRSFRSTSISVTGMPLFTEVEHQEAKRATATPSRAWHSFIPAISDGFLTDFRSSTGFGLEVSRMSGNSSRGNVSPYGDFEESIHTFLFLEWAADPKALMSEWISE